MQAVATIQSPPYRIALYPADDGLVADLQDLNTQQHFLKEQIQYGVLGDLPRRDLLVKIKSMETKLAAFAFPKENPTELWLFEAVPMAALAIRQGKEHLREEEYKKALKQFNTALKIQRLQKGETADLERAIGIIQKKKDILKWQQTAILYLPNEKAIEAFESILRVYGDQDDIYACFQTLIAIEDHLLPHHYLMAAIVHEKQKSWQEAIKAYLQLAEHDPRAMACLHKAYALLEKAQWLDRRDGVRMIFEKVVMQLSAEASFDAPTCFICFNEEEKDVAEWLEKTFVPNLDLAGIKPIICLQKLYPGQDVSSFHELARRADTVIVVCTPKLKEKYEERKKVAVGLAQEIRLIKERYHDKDKANTIFPIFLKGAKELAAPIPHLEPILGVKFSLEPLNLDDFVHAFELFAAMRKLSSPKDQKFYAKFIQGVKVVLQGGVAPHELEHWQLERKQRVQALPDTIIHRIAQMTKMMNLPLPIESFTGRKQELEELHTTCRQKHRVAITGLGGVGKTTLAIEYANRYQHHYSLIHFMSAGTSELIVSGLLKLADDLFVPTLEKIEERLALLKVALDRREQEYLLILDGVDNIDAFAEMEKYLPKRGRCLLLTSRLPKECDQLGFERIELKPLSTTEASHYLLTATRSHAEEKAKELANQLGCLPLALTHAAGYMRWRNMSIQAYAEQSTHFHLELFENRQLDLKDEAKTILKTWQISMQAIVNIHRCPLAQDILAFFAFLGQAPIPFSFVKKWFENIYPRCHQLELSNALAQLGNYSMLAKSPLDTYSVHPLVQQVTCYQLSLEEQKHYLVQALQLCQTIVHELDLYELKDRRQLDSLMPHFSSIVKHASENKSLNFFKLLEKIWEYNYFDGRYQELEQIAQLCLKVSQNLEERTTSLDCLGQSLYQLGKYKEALGYQEEALENKKSLLGKKHLDVASSLSNMGLILQELGRYQEALSYQMQALQIRKELPGDKHSHAHVHITSSLNNIGLILQELGKYQEALDYQKQVLQIRKKFLGEKHPSLVKSLGNVGTILESMGNYAESLRYQRQALELGKEIMGEKHPTVVTSLGNVGTVLELLGRYSESLQCQMQAWEIKKEILGDKHPAVAISLNNIGVVLGKLGKHKEALQYHMQSLELKKKKLGVEHPDVAESFNNIGVTLRNLGRYKEALQYQRQDLKLCKEILGPEHPKVALSLSNVGLTLSRLGKHQKGLAHLQKALNIFKKHFGNKHPHVAETLSNIGVVLEDLDKCEEALDNQKQALLLKQELLGDKHPDIAVSLSRVGAALFALGRYEEALQHQKQALELLQDILGDKHPDVATALSNEGVVLGKLGRYEEALDYQRQALLLEQELLGDKHPDVAVSLCNVGSTLWKLGKREEGLQHQIQGLKLKKEILGDKHPEVAISLCKVGSTLWKLGKREEGLQYQMKGLKLKKEILGDKHLDLDVAVSLCKVGSALFSLERHEEALQYQKQALKLMQDILGDKHLSVATTISNVGTILEKLGRPKEALSYQMQALELKKEILGDKHSDVAISLGNVGSTLFALGRYKEALQYQKQALKLEKEALGNKHPDMAISLNNVGLVLSELGNHEEALKYYQKALALTKEILGNNHLDVAKCLNHIGLTLWKLGRCREALNHFFQLLHLRKELLGDEHPDVAESFNDVGLTLLSLDRPLN